MNVKKKQFKLKKFLRDYQECIKINRVISANCRVMQGLFSPKKAAEYLKKAAPDMNIILNGKNYEPRRGLRQIFR